jgi:hypothetical protein
MRETWTPSGNVVEPFDGHIVPNVVIRWPYVLGELKGFVATPVLSVAPVLLRFLARVQAIFTSCCGLRTHVHLAVEDPDDLEHLIQRHSRACRSIRRRRYWMGC